MEKQYQEMRRQGKIGDESTGSREKVADEDNHEEEHRESIWTIAFREGGRSNNLDNCIAMEFDFILPKE